MLEVFMSSESSSSISHITAKTPLTPTINAWKIYLDDQGSSIHTIKAFSADVKLLASYLPPDRQVGAITTKELNDFLNWMKTGRGVPCSPKTLSRRITSLKSFFRWLQNNGIVLVDPAEKVIQKSVLSPLPSVLTEEEVHAVLETADRHRHGPKPDSRPFTLVELLLHTGIKKGECLAISPNHIDLETSGGPLLFVRYASPQHRYKERKIPLSESWVNAYSEYENQYEINDRLFPWSPRRLEYILEDISKEAGLEKHLSFLMCRWTSALTDLNNEIEPNKIRQKLGISEIQWREVRMKLQLLAGDEIS
ncbi:MAG: tyrosine-type recombinase/integrase [Chloroflexi bacterium]|nr:tyrosine-type recombinase/integrase [Chloroflexota bacterium]